MKKLDFNISFTGFSNMDFLSAMAAVHTNFIFPHAPSEYNNGYDYHITPGGMQEDWYFILGTMSGQFSLAENFDKSIKKPDSSAAFYREFCMKFLGYRYTVAESEFAAALKTSIDRGKPVIAVLNQRSFGRNCSVLIGYEEDNPIAAEPKGAQGENAAPTYADIESLYIITDKCEPEYTLIDGLRNIESSLKSVLDCGIWDDLKSRFDFFKGGYKTKPIEEIKVLFCRLREMMWDFDRCHNVSSVFAHKAYSALQDDRLAGLCHKIDEAYSDTHDIQWALQALYDLRHWNKKEWYSLENGMFMFAQSGIERLKKNDEIVLSCVQKMIDV